MDPMGNNHEKNMYNNQYWVFCVCNGFVLSHLQAQISQTHVKLNDPVDPKHRWKLVGGVQVA